MLHLIDESLEEFLRKEVPLDPTEVDISFEAPDAEWGAGVSMPTLNLFLWDIRRSGDEAKAGPMLVGEGDDRQWREPQPRIAFRYMVTAWTNEVRDEHRLLGVVMAALVAHRVLPEQYRKGDLARLEPPPSIKVGSPAAKDFVDLWSALEGRIKTGVDLAVVATMDTGVARPAGPDVERVEVAAEHLGEPRRVERRRMVGGRVAFDATGRPLRSPRGRTVISEEGRFVVPAEPGDDVIVDGSPPGRGEVPAQGLTILEEFTPEDQE